MKKKTRTEPRRQPGKIVTTHELADWAESELTKKAGNIPQRELWLSKNANALAAVKLGLRQSAAGKVKYLGSFVR